MNQTLKTRNRDSQNGMLLKLKRGIAQGLMAAADGAGIVLAESGVAFLGKFMLAIIHPLNLRAPESLVRRLHVASQPGRARRLALTGRTLSAMLHDGVRLCRPLTASIWLGIAFTPGSGIPMIFAEMEYQEDYWDFHEPLLAFLCAHFPEVQSGIQGDSWIWVFAAESKVAIDTFSSMKHQIKSDQADPLVQKVIETLKRRYTVRVYETPELEGHDDA